MSHKAHEKFTLEIEDIQDFEASHGIITPGSCVITYTGWSKYWLDNKKYVNNYLFPSISASVANYFIEKEINGIGIDCLSPDRPSDGFKVHQILLGQQKYIIENVANADLLPPSGSFIMALPLKIQDATNWHSKKIKL